MQAQFLRLWIGWPIAATALLLTSGAVADDNDPLAIEQRLQALEAKPENRTLLRDPAARARHAIKRVLDARAAGDAVHAVALAALADDWAKLAADVVRAVELEKALAAEQAKLTDLEQQRRRTETLLEATIAQRERTREELNRVKERQAASHAASAKPGKANVPSAGSVAPASPASKSETTTTKAQVKQ